MIVTTTISGTLGTLKPNDMFMFHNDSNKYYFIAYEPCGFILWNDTQKTRRILPHEMTNEPII